MNIAQDGHLVEELEYGNHRSDRGHADDIAKKVVTDVVTGLALVVQRKLHR